MKLGVFGELNLTNFFAEKTSAQVDVSIALFPVASMNFEMRAHRRSKVWSMNEICGRTRRLGSSAVDGEHMFVRDCIDSQSKTV